MLTKRDLLRSAALAAFSVTTTKSVPASAQTSARWPEVFEAKDIAEEGFIYGLPLVMNYAVMHEFAVDKNSEPVQGAVQRDQQRAPRRYPGRTRRSSRRTATRRTRCSGWICARSRWSSRCRRSRRSRYYAVQLIDGNTYNYGYIGSRATGTEAGRLSRGRPGLERRDARGDQEGLPIDHAVLTRPYPHPALQSRRHAERRENAGWLQGATAFRVPEAARAACRAEDRFPPGHDSGDQRELLPVS